MDDLSPSEELVRINDALDEFGAQHHPEPVSVSACVEEAMTTLRVRIANLEKRANAAEQAACGLAFDFGRVASGLAAPLEAATLHVYWPYITRTPAGRVVDEAARDALAVYREALR